MTWRCLTLGVALSLLGVACGSDDEPTDAPPSGSPSVVHRIEGVPEEAQPAERIGIVLDEVPSALSLLGGAALVGTPSGLLGGSLADDTLVPVILVAEAGEPTTTGAVSAFARRSAGGVIVSAEEGLFHDAQGVFLPSPLTESLAGKALATIDAFGADEAEELWITTDAGAIHVGAGEITSFAVPGVAAAPDAAVGVAPGQAIVTAAGSAYVVDLTAKSVLAIADGLGATVAFDRADDGVAYLATEGGLLVRTRSGEISLWTFAPVGSTPAKVLAVSAAFGSVLVVAGGGLVQLDGATAKRIGEATAPPAQGITLDANGQTWLIDGDELYRFATGAPVGFEADVKPFVEAHCMKCHAVGADDTVPDRDWGDYAVAKENAAAIVERLEASDARTMPPPNEEVLSAADYSVVTRWVAGGTEP